MPPCMPGQTAQALRAANLRWTSAIFYRLLNRLADIPIPLETGDFRLMDHKVVDAFLAMPERDRFTRGMVAWTGFRQEPVEYARAVGEARCER